MKYKVKVHKRVQKYLSKLTPKQKSNILSKLKTIRKRRLENFGYKEHAGRMGRI